MIGLGKKKKMIVFTAPSGAGKTTLVKHMLSSYGFLDFSISATTRSKRPNEIEGKDYYYLSVEEFKNKIDQNLFVEWEEVYENQLYGTLISEVERIWQDDKAIIFDIDVKGACNIKSQFQENCLTIFVKPPSEAILIERLMGRATESKESLEKRIAKVKREISFENRFDAVIVNDLLEVAKKEAEILVENFINH
ncbi:MAG: hypothetical protein RLZZ546_3070 [Bacteroidota bacterium]|jgi:guanylate kinase